MFDSVSFVAMNTALDGLALRQRVIADNVANIQTPGFLAGRVTFEDSLAAAVADGSGVGDITTSQSLAAPRQDGNNVDLQTETVLNIQTQLRYQLATQAVNQEFSLMRAAMKSI
ncbi:flagellar basal body protein [Isoptericola sp. b441]|uniref:Flagellar basal body rod protein FlgB n=1 Tax=Actinotalea lenta TaxID=3064654 RepID=A0ABT9D5R1_9CELL|nr:MULTISPECIES: flagellar basal body protein [unclassified Isoptericola]MDO8106126.1 flagellar basal body protein [Isoptericola sp. b441]MDO8122155.1 flagellar basal body protein [Isoptericola sp. b490]